MKEETTAIRLRTLMQMRNLKQIDILKLCEPYCKKYNVKLNKNDLSQYVNGKVEPGQFKLTVLSHALNVSEAWLMGFDVPMTPQPPVKLLALQLSEDALHVAHQYEQLDEGDQGYIRGQLDLLLRADKYKKKENSVG